MTRFYKFQTLRERAGYGLNMKHKMDYLHFVRDDIHWFVTMITQTAVFLFLGYRLRPGRGDIDENFAALTAVDYAQLYGVLGLR